MPKGKNKTKSQRRRLGEAAGIIIIAVGIFIGVCVFIRHETGILGGAVHDVLFGLFGLVTYATPFIFIVIGAMIIAARSKKVNKGKVALIITFLVALMSLVHTLALPEINITGGFFTYVKHSYIVGQVSLFGAGAVGCLIVYPFYLLIGYLGCIIFFVTSALVSVLVLTNLSLKKMGQDVARASKRTVERAIESVASRKKRIDMANILAEETKGDPNEPEILGAHSFMRRKKSSYLDDQIFEDVAAKAESLPLPGDRSKAAGQDAEERIEIKPEKPHNANDYSLPPISLLTRAERKASGNMDEQKKKALVIEETLSNFGVEAEVTHIVKGPVVTRYEIKPAPGVRVKRIKELENDISLSLAARSIKIEAPIPGKSAVGIEVPNSNVTFVHLRPLLESAEFKKSQSPLTFALGKDIAGKNYYVDITKMPHILIAGETGAGKSVCINSLITSLLFKATPNDLKLVMIDPKVVELSIFKSIPHLLVPVVTDVKKAAGALNWAVSEMTSRYKQFADLGARDIRRFNASAEERLARIVVIIDELSELMMSAPREVEEAICRIAQLGRAAGIHLIVATQRPSVNVITGIIKANISSRIAFKVNSGVDSRTILDQNGAEKLLGNGDMLYHPTGAPKPIRLQGCYVSDADIESVTEYVSKCGEGSGFDEEIINDIESEHTQDDEYENFDELLPKAVEIALEYDQVSISMLQRRLRVGYARAARLVDEMEQRNIVSPFEGSKARNVLITWDTYNEMFGG